MDYGYSGMLKNNLFKSAVPEAGLTLLIAKALIEDNKRDLIGNFISSNRINWKKFSQLIFYHELYPFAYSCLKKHSNYLPAKELELLERHHYACVKGLINLWGEFQKISAAFRNKNLDFIPIKGLAYLANSLYKDNAYLRPMCDLDILIKKEMLPEARKIMADLEYRENLLELNQCYWEEDNYHLPFRRAPAEDNAFNLEIHWALDYTRKKPILPDLWNRIYRYETEGTDLCLLSPEDSLFCLALHQRRFGKILCLKNACDTARLLKNNPALDWGYIIKAARSGDMRASVYFILAQAKLLFDIEIGHSMIDELRVPRYKKMILKRHILENILNPGPNFTHEENLKLLFLKSHFLLYDNLIEPVRMILNIPREQFAKFYGLRAYGRKAAFLYNLRYLIFIPLFIFNLFLGMFRKKEKALI